MPTTVLILTSIVSLGFDPNSDELNRQFRESVRPVVDKNCFSCHNSEKAKGGLDLSIYDSAASAGKDFRKWDLVLEQIRSKTMPPANAKNQPSDQERTAVIEWIKSIRKFEAKRTAGDPGIVPARRLSNAEYDNTIRDLTGVDLRPTKEFPVDPANESGFDNSAESLTMSPALVKKYLQAARNVADHLVLKPDGFSFAEFIVLADTDRDKYSVRQVIDFYKRQKTDLADFFFAAWKYRYRTQIGRPNDSLIDFAKQDKISAKYLTTIWDILNSKDEVGPINAIQAIWNDLPASNESNSKVIREKCEQLRDGVIQLRKQLTPVVKNLKAPGMSEGSQPLILWKNREQTANRMHYSGGSDKIKVEGIFTQPNAVKALTLPTNAEEIKKYELTFNRFCEVFPDAFLVSERARAHLTAEQEKSNSGRLLNAGFHSMTGYYRDDEPLYKLILDRDGQQELDRLWREFDFITNAPQRQYTSFIWYEHAESAYIREPEFDSFRAEDKDATNEIKMKKLSELFLAKVKKRCNDVVQKAVIDHFRIASENIRRVESDRIAAEPKHVKSLEDFAEKAYRRPLAQSERQSISAFYRLLRDRDGLNHEDAVRDSIVSILMSPNFCFRTAAVISEKNVQSLNDHELANRLSYFLWASMPDDELLAKAKDGELHKPEVLISQSKRLLMDPRSRGLALEFAGNWLDVRRFEEHNGVDRDRFPTFNTELRQAMFEEPIQFFLDAVHSDRSILDFIYGKHTFVNRPLAKHYGMPEVTTNEWVKIETADQYGRGGLIPMAVFLTKNAPGLRTSPVKRGYWVVRKLLGETIPAPPSQVPELPNDEAKLDLPLREMLARHRADRLCSACHDRFDGIGLTFEGFGPIGELRTKDLGGKPVQTKAQFPGGTEGSGMPGLQKYIRENRQDDFVDNFCRKMLAYALGRGLIPGDDELIESMKSKLAKNNYRFGIVIDSIVTSSQFLNRRINESIVKETNP